MAETRDWSVVQHRACPECGFDASALAVDELAPAARDEGRRWARLVGGLLASGADLRRHPDEATWSALEYTCHVRDVLAVFADRVARSLAEDDPDLGWWDHEAAVDEERYDDQDPAAVVAELAERAERLAGALDAVPRSGWGRTARRRGSEPFTVAGLARFALHESAHHRADAERAATG
ncbi:MAG: DinB family protein [Acidimicrobiales bacterium]|nr:DinB family protein [Acidimicrobiales bacterium]